MSFQTGGWATRCGSLSFTVIRAGASRLHCYQKQQVERCLSDPWMGSGLFCFWWSWPGNCCFQSELGRPSMKISCVPSTRGESRWIHDTSHCQVMCLWSAFYCTDQSEHWCVSQNVSYMSLISTLVTHSSHFWLFLIVILYLTVPQT